MARGYETFLKRHLPWIKFATDSGLSWFVSIVGFFYVFSTIGIIHGLGVFFESWIVKYQVSEATLIWIQSAYYASNMIFGPLVVCLEKMIPGQLLMAVASVINCVAHIVVAYLGSSVLLPIIAIGCFAGFSGSVFGILPLQYVGRAFKRFRPIGMTIANLGASVGYFVMPYIASGFWARFGLNVAIMALGLLWLINLLLALFLVNIEDEEDDQDADQKSQPRVVSIDSNIEESPTRQSAFIPPENEGTIPKKSCNNLLCSPVLKTRRCISLMIYVFFHYGGVMGIVVLLPALLTESFMTPADMDSMNGQDKVTTALAVLGCGGIVGNILLGIALTFGPFATKRYILFVGNNAMLLIGSVLLIFVQSYEYLCVIVTLVGFCHEAWFTIIWVLIYDFFTASDALDISGILYFCRGVATLTVPAFQSLILETLAQTDSFSSNGSSFANISTPFGVESDDGNGSVTHMFGAMALNVSQDAMTTIAPVSYSPRSFGNQVVMTMLCGLLSLALFCQISTYFLVFKQTETDRRLSSGTDIGRESCQTPAVGDKDDTVSGTPETEDLKI